jgi:solute carrier family 35 protein F5
LLSESVNVSSTHSPTLQSPSFPPLVQACLLIVSVACCWVIAGDLVHFLSFGLKIKATFFLTWLCNCELSLLLIYHALQKRGNIDRDLWLRAAKAGGLIFPLFVCAQFSYNLSLSFTSITSTTVLSSTSSAFTLLLSYIFLNDSIGWMKISGVLVTVLGATLTGMNDGVKDTSEKSSTSSDSSHWMGDLLALLSAVLYACYSVTTARVLKASASDQSLVDSTPPIELVLGFVGLFNLLTLWPLIVVLQVTGKEDLFSLSPLFFALVISKGLFDNVLSGLMWANAIKLGGPTLASVGLSLTIPLALASDWALPYGNGSPDLLLSIGAFLTVCGFVLSALSESQREEQLQQQQQQQEEQQEQQTNTTTSESSQGQSSSTTSSSAFRDQETAQE